MRIRTDLAVEFSENCNINSDNIKFEKRLSGETVISDTETVSEKAAKEVGKQKEKYVMLESVIGSDIFELPDISEYEPLIVTLRNIDRFTEKAAYVIYSALNKVLQPDLVNEIMSRYV